MDRKFDCTFRIFFEKVGDTNICKLCKASYKGDYLTNLKRHLIKKHEESYKMHLNNDESEIPIKKTKFSVTMAPDDMKNACIALATTEKLPFSFFDSEPFKVITKQIFDGLDMAPITSRNVMGLIAEEYEKKRNWLSKKLKNKLLSLKIDTATRLNRDSKIVIKTLGCIELMERHTAENLKIEVEKVLESFGITKNQIYTVTTDNDRNLIKMVEILDEDADESEEDQFEIGRTGGLLRELSVFSVQSIKCAAHSLQLAVKDYLEIFDNDVIKRARALVKTLRTPSFRSKTADLNLPQVSIDVQTRWNSTYSMLKSLIAYKTFCLRNVDAALNLRQSDWENVETLASLLEPVYIATQKLQDEQLFLSDFFKIWLEMKLEIEVKPNSSELISILERRQVAVLENPTVLSALYLDPRLRCILVREPLKLMCARSHLKHAIVRILTLEKRINNHESDEQPSTSEEALRSSQDLFETTTSQTSLLGQYLNSLNVDNEEDCDEYADEETIKKAYFEIDNFSPRPFSIEKTLFEFWETKKIIYPYLYALTKVIQCVPATQVSVERAFSALRLVLMLRFTKLNSTLIFT